MLKQRIITAAIALPIALLVLILAPARALIVVFSMFVVAATYEIASMLTPRLEGILMSGSIDAPLKQNYPRWIVGLAVLFAVGIFVASAQDSSIAGRGMVLTGTLGSILIGCFMSPTNNIAVGRVFTLLISICYGAFPWLAAWDLYIMKENAACLIFLIAVVFGGDTGAYFGGKRFGRMKLAPRMSPNKTIEGSIAGLASSIVCGSFVNLVYGGVIGTWSTVAIASLLGGMFGQLGDLVESTFKRFSLVKDSGVVFPGHGGFLDRVDGVLFAAPVIWFILYLSHI